MNRTLKYILISVAALALAACFTASYIAGVQARRTIVCKSIRIEVLDSAQNSFVTADDIRKFIRKSCGELVGEPLDSIDLVKVEKAVDSRSAVLKSQAYVTRDSILNIKVTQRRPVVRFQKKDGGFYADAEGYIFPLQSTYASHVQIIDGDIPLAANSGYKGDITDPKETECLFHHLHSRQLVTRLHMKMRHQYLLIRKEKHGICHRMHFGRHLKNIRILKWWWQFTYTEHHAN